MNNHSTIRISNRKFSTSSVLTLVAASLLVSAPAAQATCGNDPVALQVLGSGGPFGYGRASAGYLVWIDGTARVMVDAGGGTFTRFHEAGAKVADLELLALSHFHPDHSSEVPALLWVQRNALTVAGPTGSDGYPTANEYVTGLFGPEGVFRAVTNGKGLTTVMVDVEKSEPTEVYSNDSLRVRGLGVPHGIVPAVGYRIDIGDVSIAFSSDQNGSDPAFVKFASGVDVLVVHVAVPETVSGSGADFTQTQYVGQMATDAGIGTLVLSHLSAIAPRNVDDDLVNFEEKLGHLRSNYKGPLVIAEDLICVPIKAN